MPLAFLIIDCGSSSCRAAVAEASSRLIVPGTLIQLPFALNDDTEFDADALVAIVIGAATQSLQAAARTRPDLEVGLVGVSVFAVTIICLDSDMKPLWNACSYADKRTFSFAESARSSMQPDMMQQLYESTGTPLAYPYAPAHIQRLRASKSPQQWWLPSSASIIYAFSRVTRRSGVHRVCTLGAFITHRLTGHLRMSSCEAGWTGMFDRESFSWNAAALKLAADLQPSQLPELHDACAPESSLPISSSCLLALHLPPHVRVLLPISDGAAANLGAGCVDNTCACLTVGTSIALRTVVKSRAPPAISSSCGLWSYHLHSDLWLVGGALSDGGNLVAWLLKTMKFDLESWESEVAAMPPAAHRLVVLPFASGERSTGYRGDASFHVSGAETSTSPTQIMRATMEAVALRALALWQRMLPFMQADACVIASGGALMTSTCWARIFSDAMGVPVVVCGENKEASIMGIISQCTTYLQNSASASGASPSALPSDDPRKLQIEVLQPESAAHALYASALTRQEELYSVIYGQRKM